MAALALWSVDTSNKFKEWQWCNTLKYRNGEHGRWYIQGRILGRNPDKSLKSFPPCYLQSSLCTFASYSFHSSLQYTVKEKEGQPDRKPFPLPYGLRNPLRNLKSESSQDYAQKPQRNCTFMNSASGLTVVLLFRHRLPSSDPLAGPDNDNLWSLFLIICLGFYILIEALLTPGGKGGMRSNHKVTRMG